VLSHSFKNKALQRWNWVLHSLPTWSLDNSLSSNWIKDRIKNSLGWIDRVNQIYVECHYIKLIEASAKIQCFLTHFLPFERPLFCHVQPLFWQQKGAKFPEKKKKKKHHSCFNQIVLTKAYCNIHHHLICSHCLLKGHIAYN
jgi:hypothetical protein